MPVSLRRVVDDHWERLEEERVSGPDHVRTSELPVTTPAGSLLAAVDHMGNRHVLVPLTANQHVRTDRRGAALAVRERPLENGEIYERYADLGCLRRDLDEVFTGLVSDVLSAVETTPERPLKALYTVLNRWRDLFRHAPAPLGIDQLAGLFGELVVLNELLAGRSTAVDFWTGPSGHHHDFTIGSHGIEVKTSTATRDRTARIHGINQLQPPPHGDLDLVWIRLESVAEQGKTLAELVESARRAGDDDASLLLKLAEAGYLTADAERYHDVRFEIREQRWYEVGEDFPRIDPAAVPADVSELDYTLDLAGQRPHATDPDEIRARVQRITRENT
ncbi:MULTISPECIES: PD-(D/E)XK motif protein [Amycolatopsis]|uniref:PD-(D/E)XK motif protein n=1 Tax=Amycolatopsis albidoflavus TaxID=102226 RepID=A0ABW5HV30_9PSEU